MLEETNKLIIYAVSTAFIPAGFEGKVTIFTLTAETVKEIFKDNPPKTSFIGHKETANWLEVPFSKAELLATDLKSGVRLMGIRPKKRIKPGEQVKVSAETFEGFVLRIDLVFHDFIDRS